MNTLTTGYSYVEVTGDFGPEEFQGNDRGKRLSEVH